MKIAILDDYQDCVKTLDCFSLLKNHEVIVLNHHYDDPNELLSHLKGVQALVLIRERTNVNEALISKLPDLKLIAQTGKAGRHLDLKACKAHGVQVLETEGTSTATAEFTLLMILASLRHFEAEVTHGAVARRAALVFAGVGLGHCQKFLERFCWESRQARHDDGDLGQGCH